MRLEWIGLNFLNIAELRPGDDDQRPSQPFLLRVLARDPEALAALATAAKNFETAQLQRLEADEGELDTLMQLTAFGGAQRSELRQLCFGAVRAELQRRQVNAGVLPA